MAEPNHPSRGSPPRGPGNGHFRHEIGHYYWTELVSRSRWLESFRALFGDERDDYAAALQRHYAREGSRPGARRGATGTSAPTSSHPWEDWAETWAHYLHIVDTIETAAAFGVKPSGASDDRIDEHLFAARDAYSALSKDAADFASMLRDWVWLTLAMNAINRSMGMRDAYPFTLNAGVIAKLQMVHAIIAEAETTSRAFPKFVDR